jgi:hypothetical protein
MKLCASCEKLYRQTATANFKKLVLAQGALEQAYQKQFFNPIQRLGATGLQPNKQDC